VALHKPSPITGDILIISVFDEDEMTAVNDAMMLIEEQLRIGRFICYMYINK